jgi:hypothetical protein
LILDLLWAIMGWPEQRVVDIESFVGLLRANNGYTAKTPLFLTPFFWVKGI